MQHLTKPLEGVAVLIVEDNDDAREVLGMVLRDVFGASVTAVESADAAVAQLAQTRPDVVVADIAMPRHDGFWLLAEIRRAFGTTLPVIAVSGHVAGTAVLKAGFDEFLQKPAEPPALCDAIARLARRAS